MLNLSPAIFIIQVSSLIFLPLWGPSHRFKASQTITMLTVLSSGGCKKNDAVLTKILIVGNMKTVQFWTSFIFFFFQVKINEMQRQDDIYLKHIMYILCCGV